MFKFRAHTLVALFTTAFWWGLGNVESALAASTTGFFGSTDDPCAYWKAIFDFGIKVAGALSMCMIVFGGFLWLISGNESEKLTKAKDYIKGALVGLFMAMLSYVGFLALNPYMLQCKIEIPDMQGVAAETSDNSKSFSPPVSVCGNKKTYKTQGECEKAESKCSDKKSSRCVLDKKASSKDTCKKSGEKVTDKSECCSDKIKYTEGTVPQSICDGDAFEKKYCCAGDIKAIYVHWTAGPNTRVGGSYHYVVTGDGVIHKLAEDKTRRAHTANRNTGGIGISAAGIDDCTPKSYAQGSILGETCKNRKTGKYIGDKNVFTTKQIAAMKGLIAQKKSEYQVSTVMTHYQAATIDNYACDQPKNSERKNGSCRWDFMGYSF